jgi:hypothetical protein
MLDSLSPGVTNIVSGCPPLGLLPTCTKNKGRLASELDDTHTHTQPHQFSKYTVLYSHTMIFSKFYKPLTTSLSPVGKFFPRNDVPECVGVFCQAVLFFPPRLVYLLSSITSLRLASMAWVVFHSKRVHD